MSLAPIPGFLGCIGFVASIVFLIADMYIKTPLINFPEAWVMLIASMILIGIFYFVRKLTAIGEETAQIFISSKSNPSLITGNTDIKLKIDNYNVSRFGHFDILLNGTKIDNIETGRSTIIKIPSGQYELKLIPQGSQPSNTLAIDAVDNDTITISAFIGIYEDWFLINETNTPVLHSFQKEVRRVDVSRLAYISVFIAGSLGIVSGLLLQILKSYYLNSSDVNSYSITSVIAGLIFLLLGLFVTKKSNIALIITTFYYALDFVWVFIIWHRGNNIYLYSLILHVFLIIPMIQGIFSLYLLKKNKRPHQEYI